MGGGSPPRQLASWKCLQGVRYTRIWGLATAVTFPASPRTRRRKPCWKSITWGFVVSRNGFVWSTERAREKQMLADGVQLHRLSITLRSPEQAGLWPEAGINAGHLGQGDGGLHQYKLKSFPLIKVVMLKRPSHSLQAVNSRQR